MVRRFLAFCLIALPLAASAQVVQVPGGQAPVVSPEMVGVKAATVERLVGAVLKDSLVRNVGDALSFASAEVDGDVIAGTWQMRQAAPELFDLAIERYKFMHSDSSRIRAMQAVFFAVLASDTTQLNQLVEAADKDSARVRQDIRSIGRLVIGIIKARSGTDVMVFATGDVRTATANQTDDFRSGTGSLGVLYTNSARRKVMASITVASTETQIASGYGSAILAPSQGQAFRSGVLSAYWPDSTNKGPLIYPPTGWDAIYKLPVDIALAPIGIARSINYVYTTVSVERWQYTIAPADTQKASATVLGIGLLHRAELGCCRILTNEVGTYADLGFSVRWLSGDISSRDSVRRALLHTTTPVFLGPETGIQIQFGRVNGSLQLYYLFASAMKSGPIHVDGLTRLQAVAAFTVTGEVFRGPVSR